MKQPKKYTGSCYIGVVGSENENGECRDTIEQIQRTKRDMPPQYIRATKGYEARQMHLNNWYTGTKHAFLLLLDHDMKFPPHTLARLRAHGLPFISGFYMRRRYNPVAPVWFEHGEMGQMPLIPFTAPPQANTVYKIGGSGWGCMLIHRDVVTATRKLLKGEPDIIEDDMDIYPYDLPKLLKAVAAFKELDNSTVAKDLLSSIQVIVNEIRPLRGVKDVVGSDIRYPFFARIAGFDLHGDTGVICEHMINYPLHMNDYNKLPAETVRDITVSIREDVLKERKRLEKAVRV